jgi:hypothetical protein
VLQLSIVIKYLINHMGKYGKNVFGTVVVFTEHVIPISLLCGGGLKLSQWIKELQEHLNV